MDRVRLSAFHRLRHSRENLCGCLSESTRIVVSRPSGNAAAAAGRGPVDLDRRKQRCA